MEHVNSHYRDWFLSAVADRNPSQGTGLLTELQLQLNGRVFTSRALADAMLSSVLAFCVGLAWIFATPRFLGKQG